MQGVPDRPAPVKRRPNRKVTDMKLFLLMVLFSTPDKPEPHELAGLQPRTAETMEECLQRRNKIHNYIEANKRESVKFKAFCVEVKAEGYSEAVDSFKREIGRRL